MFRITKVEEKDIPKKVTYNKLKAEIQGFMDMSIKVAKIDTGDHYSNVNTAVKTLYNSIKRYGFPIDVIQRNGEVFFIRRDM